MKRSSTPTHRAMNLALLVTGGLLVAGIAGSSAAFKNPSFGNPPESFNITGIIRDFHESHPDMERQPDAGFGLYTGNLGIALSPERKPIFTGEGAQVTKQFRDKQGRPIAPHMYNRHFECMTEYPESECVTLSHSASGGGQATYKVCFVDATFNEDGTSTWRYTVEEVHGPSLSHWTLWLNPDVEVLEGTTPGWEWIGENHQNFPGPGIKWDMGGGVKPGEFEVVLDKHYYGTNASWVQAKGGGGTHYAQAPFFGPSIEQSLSGSPYKSVWLLVHDPAHGDEMGEFGEYGSGGISSEESFKQWFNDSLGVNISAPLTITLDRQYIDGQYVYVFDDQEDPVYSKLNGFFPIDGQLFGNSGGHPNHNYHFTYELQLKFTYDSEEGQFLRVVGGDDIWVFVDGRLGIDLGGVHGPMEQYIDMNRMCLECGESYTMTFFFVQRHRTESNLRIETNIELDTLPLPTTTSAYD